MAKSIIAALLAVAAASCAGKAKTQTVAFDNNYNARLITVYVSVDGAREEAYTARCTDKTCAFKVPMTPGAHDLSLSVSLAEKSDRSNFTVVKVQAK